MFDIILRLIVNTVRSELTDVIKYAAVCRITGLASHHPQEFTLPSPSREV